MGKNIEHIQHLRSNEVVNGQPKAPTANNLLDGEIAVNYATGNETLFIKSGDGSNVKSFSNDDNFYKKGAIDDIVSGINDTISGMSGTTQSEINALDEKKFDASGITGYTTTAATKALNDVVTAHTGDATVHFTTGTVQTQIDNSISGKCDTSAFTAHTSSTVHMDATEKTNLDSLATNIGAISGISSQKVTNWDNAYGDSHTHSNKTALDSITGNVGTMAYANESSYSSATQVNTALAGKSNTGHTHHSNEVGDMSGYTKPSSTSAIATGDTLNAAIGKLEKAIDGLQPVGSYVEMSAFTAHTSSTVHMNATEKTNLDSLATNIGAISGISSQKVTNWDNASTNSHTHSNKTALDSITGNVGTMAYANESSYSSATQVNTALAGKSNTGHTHHSNEVGDMSGYTKPSSTSAIVTGDTLNAAIGKLEKAIDGRQPVGSYVETSTYTSYTSTTQSTINSKANSSTTVSSADYYVSGTTHQLRFKDVAGNVISTVDAGEFIKDGMIDTVEIRTVPYSGETQPCLVITWNTDAGKDVTYIPIKNIFNPNEYVPTGRTITTASGLTGGGNLGSNRTIGLEATGTADTYYVVNTDAYGRVTGGTTTVPYSSATQVNTALAGKSDTGHTHDNIYYTKAELTGSSAITVTKATSAGTAASVARATFGDGSNGEHNANNIASNGMWYYSSNGPTTGQGASTADGALYSQAYSTSWVGQIAQDYRNGRLFVRGKNNGSWTSWLNIIDSGNIGSQSVNYATSAGSAPASDVYSWAKQPNKPSYNFSEIGGTVTNAQLAGSIANNKLSETYVRKVTVADNAENDFNTFESMTMTGRGDPRSGASLVNAPWSDAGPAGGYGTLTYLWSGYGVQLAFGYHSNSIYVRNKFYSGGSSTWDTTWDSIALNGKAQPASDVYAWAKAATKPTYTLDEVSDGSTRKLANYYTKAELTGSSAITVAKATSAGTSTSASNADTVDGLHAESFYQSGKGFLQGSQTFDTKWNALFTYESAGGAARSFLLNVEAHHNNTVVNKTFHITTTLGGGAHVRELYCTQYGTNFKIRVGSTDSYWTGTRVDIQRISGTDGTIRFKVISLDQGTITVSTSKDVAALAYSYEYTPCNIESTVVSNSDKVDGLHVVKITQAAYDALTTKDENTLYFIYD